ncbi:hypothetical protein Tco_0495899 [Tanacetum coccineum]
MRPDPSPRPSSSILITDSDLEGSGRNHRGQSSSNRSLSGNKDGLTLQSVYDLCVSLCIQVTAQAVEIKDLKAQIKQLTKKDGLATNEAIDYTLAHDEGKTDSKVEEPKTSSKTKELHLSGDTLVVDDKGSAEKGGSTKSTVKTNESTVKPDESTIKKDESTIKPDEGTDKPDEGIDKQDEGTDRQTEGTAEYKDL